MKDYPEIELVLQEAGHTFQVQFIKKQEILKRDRADYGKKILATLPQELSQTYGKGFSYSSLTRMVKFYESFQDEEIVATLSQQLSRSHFRELFPLDKPLQRDFYAEMCRIEHWSVRSLRQKIDSILYERTAISRKPWQYVLIPHNEIAANITLDALATRFGV